jgi:hypothetical protein
MKPRSRNAVWLVVALVAVVGAAVAAGCNDACARSQDREIECIGTHAFDAGAPIDCEEVTECESNCINDAGCDQVVAYVFLDAGSSEKDQRLAGAIIACQKVCNPPAPVAQ